MMQKACNVYIVQHEPIHGQQLEQGGNCQSWEHIVIGDN